MNFETSISKDKGEDLGTPLMFTTWLQQENRRCLESLEITKLTFFHADTDNYYDLTLSDDLEADSVLCQPPIATPVKTESEVTDTIQNNATATNVTPNTNHRNVMPTTNQHHVVDLEVLDDIVGVVSGLRRTAQAVNGGLESNEGSNEKKGRKRRNGGRIGRSELHGSLEGTKGMKKARRVVVSPDAKQRKAWGNGLIRCGVEKIFKFNYSIERRNVKYVLI